MLLEWAGSIMCAVLRGVTRFATDIDMETDPIRLNGIQLCGSRRALLVCISSWNHRGCVIDPSPGLSGITVAEQGRGESSRLGVLASVAQD
jgi:hypothetical protein